MIDYILRFIIGGVVVSSFAVLAEIFRPKSFAGLFSAAPSIALATIGLTIVREGKTYASIETRSMIFGAVGFCCYAAAASWLLMSGKTRALTATVALLPVWFGVSFTLWYVLCR